MELSDQEMLELAQFAFARMDGAIINGWPVPERGGVKKIPSGIEPMQAERKKCTH